MTGIGTIPGGDAIFDGTSDTGEDECAVGGTICGSISLTIEDADIPGAITPCWMGETVLPRVVFGELD